MLLTAQRRSSMPWTVQSLVSKGGGEEGEEGGGSTQQADEENDIGTSSVVFCLACLVYRQGRQPHLLPAVVLGLENPAF